MAFHELTNGQHEDPTVAAPPKPPGELPDIYAPKPPRPPKKPRKRTKPIPRSIRAYPSLLGALYAANLATVALLYMILRALDQAGRGWLDLAELRGLLTDKRSPLRIYGRRNLRGILRKGAGVAWDIVGDRIYYRSPAKIMTALGAGRLIGSPVLLPVKAALFSGIAAFKAHTQAAWLAGRRENNPISREARRAATGTPESTQRRYDKLAGVKSGKENYAIGGVKTDDSYQDAAYTRRGNVLIFTDHVGKMGAPGKEYLSWRLPNTFEAPLQQTAKGRQLKINRQIDLVNNPEQGNGYDVDQIYYQESGPAKEASRRNPNINHYWPLVTTMKRTAYRKAKLQTVGLWSVAHA